MSLRGAEEGGGVGGGEEEGGRTLVEEEEEEEEQGAEPAWPGCGLGGLHTSPEAAGVSDAPAQASDAPLSSTFEPAPPLSLVFRTNRRRRFVTRDEEGDEADEEVEVMEPGLAFWDVSAAGLLMDEGGAARLLLFPIELRSLPRPPSERGSEHGLRNGDLLSLSRQKTTAMDPPTTELPVPPPAPPAPKRSIPSFPDAPVVLLTPSRTSTETLD